MKHVSAPGQILVLSHAGDAHIPYVQRHLNQPLIRLDKTDALQGNGLSYEFQPGQPAVSVIAGGQLLDRVRGVWFRKPTRAKSLQLPVAAPFQGHALDTFEAFSELLYRRFPEATWVSRYDATRRARDKLSQLEAARRLGMAVPDTLVTSSPEHVRHFLRRHQRVVAKSVYGGAFIHGKDARMFYTTLIDEQTDLSGLFVAPAIFQAAVERGTDIRVTVVKDQVFAAAVSGARIDDPASSIRDWRVTNSDLSAEFTPIELPPAVKEQCVAHARHFGLTFSAIDLIRDRQGTHWFLENNPNGQWAFVELATGQPIGKAIAKLLSCS